MNHSICAVLVGLLASSCVAVSTGTAPISGKPAMPSYMERLKSAEAAVGEDFLAQLQKSGEAQRAQMARSKHQELDQLALMSSRVGDEKRAHEIMSFISHGTARAPKGEGAEPFPADFKVVGAIDAIVERAMTRTIVVINESHHQPVHRAFAQRVAVELRKLGYRYLAVEALTNSDSIHPITAIEQGTGFYVGEPVFADFLRTAIAAGYELVPYESLPDPKSPPSAQLAARESGQARNIFERTLAKDPDAKVLVHAGYGHIRKSREAGQARRMMASYLAEIAGAEPLSIDQTSLMETPLVHPRLAAYDQLVQKFGIENPVVPTTSAGAPLIRGHYVGAVDIQVAHPPDGNYEGRPAWYRTLLNRRSVEVPPDLWSRSKRRLVQVFRAGDDPFAVPVDMLLLTPGKPSRRLMVPNGDLVLAFEDEADP